jgi:putative nucleotidyltransferase with HDIG domain
VLEPVLVVDPRSALELGLEPIVHAFVSELQDKDPITRDHVVRTTELAMETGRSLGLDGKLLRQLGLTALLHDIGKLEIPDAVLNKPGKLTDAEYAIVKRHADYGADLVAASKPLAGIAPSIRAHHERIDGGGYPKGLIGSQIPLIARIVSVCDAFDAMANTRQYREGLSTSRALEILEQHAGSQWDQRVVEAVVRIVRAQPPSQIPQYLDAVGRIGCDCVPDTFANAA